MKEEKAYRIHFTFDFDDIINQILCKLNVMKMVALGFILFLFIKQTFHGEQAPSNNNEIAMSTTKSIKSS